MILTNFLSLWLLPIVYAKFPLSKYQHLVKAKYFYNNWAYRGGIYHLSDSVFTMDCTEFKNTTCTEITTNLDAHIYDKEVCRCSVYVNYCSEWICGVVNNDSTCVESGRYTYNCVFPDSISTRCKCENREEFNCDTWSCRGVNKNDVITEMTYECNEKNDQDGCIEWSGLSSSPDKYDQMSCGIYGNTWECNVKSYDMCLTSGCLEWGYYPVCLVMILLMLCISFPENGSHESRCIYWLRWLCILSTSIFILISWGIFAGIASMVFFCILVYTGTRRGAS